jgi:hypothetical protein
LRTSSNRAAVRLLQEVGIQKTTSYARSGCERVAVVTKSGELETRSMAYYEYFARGTEPTQTCPLHQPPSILNRIVGLFGGGNSGLQPVPESVAPPSSSTASAQAPPSGTAGQQPVGATRAQAEQPQKKRGFWAKLFGLGKKKDAKKQEDDSHVQQPQPRRLVFPPLHHPG